MKCKNNDVKAHGCRTSSGKSMVELLLLHIFRYNILNEPIPVVECESH